MQRNSLTNLPFAEIAETNTTESSDTTPEVTKNIEKFSVQYRKYVVSEMTEELDRQARQAEQIQIVKANPKAA